MGYSRDRFQSLARFDGKRDDWSTSVADIARVVRSNPARSVFPIVTRERTLQRTARTGNPELEAADEAESPEGFKNGGDRLKTS